MTRHPQLARETDRAHMRRLAWFHGEERARRIVMGDDPETEADLAKWRGLGRQT